ncbi:MAG: hypothetical protein RBG13Loki_3565 [Promethearchaeota archaeon CR_4]|nr:MAG: hypothetical protein RBG13Loki_3565 [Candidatus Lokiarchaeota archaeon CR_4]
MIVGVSTDNFLSRPTPLSQDIADIHQLNVNAIELVPKMPMNFREGRVLKTNLEEFEYVAVHLPSPPISLKIPTINEITNYYQDAFQFSIEIGASLVLVRADFLGCESPKDVVKILHLINEHATKSGLKITLLNWFSQESQCGTYEQVSEVINGVDNKLAIDLGHAYRGMDSKSVRLIGEQKLRINAIRASDTTTVFSDLLLGTGHVNYPTIMPLLMESGFLGPFFVTHKRDPSLESIRTSISYLEYFEL